MTITKSQQNQMLDYLVSRLEPNYTTIEPKRRNLFSELLSIPLDIRTTYIKLKDDTNIDSIVLLVDKVYPEPSDKNYSPFSILYSAMKKVFHENMAVVFYKDGETFFRSAAKRHYYKKNKGLGLKYYDNKEINKMILFRPEEIITNNMQKGILQYYQPESKRLEEGIVTYTFNTVTADYSDRCIKKGINIKERDYDRDHIWSEKKYSNGLLLLKDSFLI